ncbi:M23 family metallopeptidase [Actinomarinicola tropica]|uniref:Peptidoglycan DD-metalloendopeptidase family protein n=1 Tax=Actinomarinicola tropica TaxID=2789776 RepID=A0A5Q2RJW9_9ACTN|nr:M23 family metallopeptidase [Actinomarinicola tropica]QGG94861.1 peptidoglycan DD-metalloendopeptidase family protein [Actinomarinicola tropica]
MRRAVDRPFVLVVVLALVAVALPVLPAGADTDGPVGYVHPVDAPVLDPFREPASPYGPGNRGLEYDTPAGVDVGAAAPGVVTFAGEVAGARHVTVGHPDGRLTSYSFLADVQVRRGDVVERGEVVGTTGGPLHVSVRESGRYVDPALLFGVEVTSVQLVPENPFGSQLWEQAAREVMALAALTFAEGGGWGLGDIGGAIWGAASDVAGALREVAPDLLRLAWELAPFAVAALGSPLMAVLVFELALPVLQGRVPPLLRILDETGPVGTLLRIGERTIAWVVHRTDCTPGDVEPPPPTGRRVALLVGGLSSTSSSARIGDVPVDRLGYAPEDVLGFSYEGGRTPDAFGASAAPVAEDLRAVPVTEYGTDASTTDLRRRAELLADLLEELEASAPGVEIDLFAHSQGGVVAHLALQELAGRPGGTDVIASLGLVATMGTPHHGSDLAAMAVAASETGEGALLLQVAERMSGRPLDPDTSTNVADLARDSDVVLDALADGPPDGPTYLALAARGDPVVLAARTRAPGATHVTLPIDGLTAHEQLPGHASTAREIALARAGMSPTCESFGDFVTDTFVTEVTTTLTLMISDLVAGLTQMSVVPEPLGDLAGDLVLDGGW